jgi:hypothetical protein
MLNKNEGLCAKNQTPKPLPWWQARCR